ncbi:MAG: HU family DNA-binding protein [Gammaproteobacteria bacterium]
MNKQELIDAIAMDANLSKADASRAVEAVIKTVTKALKKGDQVTLVGFGTFRARQRKARTGRNPQTGQIIQIKAAKVAAFSAGKLLKAEINGAG